jgi:flagellar hook-length control protein FliK
LRGALSAKAADANPLLAATRLAAQADARELPARTEGASADASAAASASELMASAPAADAQAGATSFSTLLQAAASLPGMAPAGPQAGASSAPGTPVHVGTPLHDPNFAPEMAARLTVLASDGVQQAELHLNPAEMGPVSINIQLDGQQAQVEFHAQHQATREVLERSLPELAAALRDAGMTLSGGGVFQQQQQQPQRDGGGEGGSGAATAGLNGAAGGSELPGSAADSAHPVRRTQIGVLDTYA